MDRDIERNERLPFAPEEPLRQFDGRSTEPEPSRVQRDFQLRGYHYQISPKELQTLHDIGRFRTVAIEDLAKNLYGGSETVMRDDLTSLRDQGLIQLRAAWTRGRCHKLPVVVLTKLGKEIVNLQCRDGSGQKIFAGFVKPREVAHDAAIYRMYQAESAQIKKEGGRIRRIVLDYELKQTVYSPLAKAKTLSADEHAKKQAQIAKENALSVVRGKIVLPDLRIEYETRTGEVRRTDLELATEHYHGSALQAKAEAGFKMYVADGSQARLSRILEERDLIAEILSL